MSTFDMVAIVAPLDALRARLLAIGGRAGRNFLRDRGRRVALFGIVGVVVALLTTCIAPLWVFAIAPLVLGVPHLLSDVRYLVVKPALAKRTVLVYAVAPPLVATLLQPAAHIGLTVGFGVIAVAHTTPLRRVCAAIVWAAVYACALVWPYPTTLVVLHGHNFFAVALLLVVFSRNRAAVAIPAALFLVVSAAFVVGAFDVLLTRPFAVLSTPARGLTLDAVIAGIAPVTDPMLGLRLAMVFVFAQSVHYAVWLRLVPEEARERPGLRSFASSVVALRADVGGWLVGAAVVAGIALIVFACATSLEIARMGYLRVSAPHAYLEIAFAMLWLLERGTGLPARRSVLGAASCSSRRGTSTASGLARNVSPNGSPSGSPT